MKPATADVVDSILSSLNDHVYPELQSPYARSVFKTAENLIRHIGLRAEKEVFLLLAEHEDIDATLRQCVEDLESDPQLAASLRTELKAVNSVLDLERPVLKNQTAAALQTLSMELRRVLDELLRGMGSLAPESRENHKLESTRSRIRDYFSNQIRRDAELIDDAFLGARR